MSLRLRITFSKGGLLAYTSHLDLARAWERSLRRAGVPLAYSAGFNPRPKLQLAAALPLGHTGEAELLDVWLEQPMPVEEFARALVPVLPDGLAVSQVCQVGLKEPALQTQVVAAAYRVTVEPCPEPVEGACPEPVEGACPEPVEGACPEPVEGACPEPVEGACPEPVEGARPESAAGQDETAKQIEARIREALAATELWQEQRGRRYDARPLIERLWLERVTRGKVVLGMQLAAREGATLRPEAVLEVLGMGGAFARYHRQRLLLATGG